MAFRVLLLVLVFALVGCSEQMAAQFLYKKDEANQIEVPDTPPVPFEQAVETSKKQSTHIWYRRHWNEKAPVVVFFHGNSSNIQGLYESDFIKDVLRMNIHLVIFDYPQYGKSTGKLNEKGVVSSGELAVDFAKQTFPNSKLFLWGRSLGASPATLIAEKEQAHITGLILTSPWNTLWQVAQHRFDLSEDMAKKIVKGHEYASDTAAQNILLPVLIHHGEEDDVIPYELGFKLFEAFASSKKEFHLIPQVGHSGIMTLEVLSQVEEFIFPVSKFSSDRGRVF